MRSGLDTRLSKLESASDDGRVVFIWEPDGEYDLGELRRQRGLGPNDKTILVSWARTPTE